MILIPAIDIKGGKVVRLLQGRFDHVTEYDNDPLKVAKHWKSEGAQWLHIVDLDGARTGKMGNIEVIKRIAKEAGIPVQVGGGIRSKETIDDLLSTGVSRVILGTKAVEDKKFLKDVLFQWGEKIVVSIDCSNGYVAQRGWASTSKIKGVDLVGELQKNGLKTIVYTDIARDGTLQGLNFKGLEDMLKATKMGVIASGGIATIEDVKKLAAMKGVVAAITGKAIYEGKLDFKEALKVCSINV